VDVIFDGVSRGHMAESSELIVGWFAAGISSAPQTDGQKA
jgi:hypothetical protein